MRIVFRERILGLARIDLWMLACKTVDLLQSRLRLLQAGLPRCCATSLLTQCGFG